MEACRSYIIMWMAARVERAFSRSTPTRTASAGRGAAPLAPPKNLSLMGEPGSSRPREESVVVAK